VLVESVRSRVAPPERGGEAASGKGDRGYWLVSRSVGGRTNVLVVEVPGGERLLPVFGGAASAEEFVRLSGLAGAAGGGWFARRSGHGELLAMLIGPRRSVRRVAVDPSAELMGAEGFELEMERACVSRKEFVERLLSERREGASHV